MKMINYLPKEFKIDKNTIFEWDIKNKNIILTLRQKLTLDDVIGMVKKEDCDDGSWDINNEIYQ